MTLSPTSWPGGGGSGAEAPLTLTGTDPATVPLKIVAAALQTARTLNIVDSGGNDILFIDPDQTSLFAGSGGQGGTDFSALDVSAGVSLFDRDGFTELTVTVEGVAFGNSQGAKVIKTGYFVVHNHAAPADAALAAGECALWFDQTNGVGNTKLMLKGKSADGTVKTAAIVLA